MGPNFTPLNVPNHPSVPPSPSKPKRGLNKKLFAVLGGLVVMVGIVAGYAVMQSGILTRSNASGAYKPIDRRPYENCWSPFDTKATGTQITIKDTATCRSLPPISIDVWKMNGSYNNQSLVFHKEYTMVPGVNTLTIPSGTLTCTDYYQIDTWLGSGTPTDPLSEYGYALITASFAKPPGGSCGPIPSQYCNTGVTVPGPACSTTPSKTPTPKPSNTPTKPPPTSTPKPSPTPTKVPSCGSACSSDSQCGADMKCYNTSVGTYNSPTGKCVLAKCLQAGVVCSADKCNVIPPTPTPTLTNTPTPTKTPTPKATNTPPPTATLSCPKPNPVKNLRINCPICKGT